MQNKLQQNLKLILKNENEFYEQILISNPEEELINKIEFFNEIQLCQNQDHFFRIDCPVIYEGENNKSVQLPIFLNISSESKIDNLIIYGSFTNKLPGEEDLEYQ